MDVYVRVYKFVTHMPKIIKNDELQGMRIMNFLYPL